MKKIAVALMVFFVVAMTGTVSQAATANEVSVQQFCQLLPAYKPSADVAYKPGVGTKGKPVMPADINTPLKVMEKRVIHVPVTVDLAQRTTLGLPAGTEMKTPVAMIEIHEDGLVEYDGQDISAGATHLCKNVKK